MIFYGNGVVWNGKEDKIAGEFVNGEFETNDSDTIELFQKLGYDFFDENAVIDAKAEEQIEESEIKSVKRSRKSSATN